jgi:hypothetical protein
MFSTSCSPLPQGQKMRAYAAYKRDLSKLAGVQRCLPLLPPPSPASSPSSSAFLLRLPPPPSSSTFLLRPLLLLSLLPRHLLICPLPTRSACCLAGSNWPLRSLLGPRPPHTPVCAHGHSSCPRRLAPPAHHPSLRAAEREDQAPFMVRGKSVSGRPRIDGGSVRVPAEFVDTHRICGRICGAKFVGK